MALAEPIKKTQAAEAVTYAAVMNVETRLTIPAGHKIQVSSFTAERARLVLTDARVTVTQRGKNVEIPQPLAHFLMSAYYRGSVALVEWMKRKMRRDMGAELLAGAGEGMRKFLGVTGKEAAKEMGRIPNPYGLTETAQMDETIVIPAGHGVCACSLDKSRPELILMPQSMLQSVKMPTGSEFPPENRRALPMGLAYFLATNEHAVPGMCERLETIVRAQMAGEMKTALGLET